MATQTPGKNLIETLYIKFLSTDTSWTSSIYTKVLGGLALGAMVVLVPLLYSGINSVEQLSSLQLCLIFLVIEVCIVVTAKLGDRFVDAITKILNDSGL